MVTSEDLPADRAIYNMEDEILVNGLEVWTNVGVPNLERGVQQRVLVDLRLCPAAGLGGLNDELERSVDYSAVCRAVERTASQGERHLIETLAEDILVELLQAFPLKWAQVQLRKFVLPNTEWVAVRMTRAA